MIANIEIKGEQALSLQNIANSKLQGANVTMEFESNVYFIFCVLTDLCGNISAAPDNDITVSSSNTANNKIPDKVIIYILLVLILIVVTTLLLIIIVIWTLKSKMYFSQAAKSTSHPHVLSTEVVFGESESETAENMPNDTRAHQHEDLDITIKHFNPMYQRNTSTQIAETLSNNLQASNDFCASNGNSQCSYLQISNTITCMSHPEVQRRVVDNVNVKFKVNDNAQVNNNSATYYDDTAISYYDDTILQSNETKNGSNYDKLQHATLDSSKILKDNEEIKWVTNPNYDNVKAPITPVGTSANKAQLSCKAADKECYDGTAIEVACKNCSSGTVISTLPENGNFSSTAWDKDKSSFVTGYSSRVILAEVKSSSTHREGNEMPINQMSLQIPVVSICEWNSTNV